MFADDKDQNIITNKFNEYFTNIGSNLAKSIPIVSGNPVQHIKGVYSQSIVILDTDENEITNIVKTLKITTSKGCDNIPPCIVKNVIGEIVKPLTIIFNESLRRGHFPEKLKIARVVPIYKSDDKLTISNYRPISILPFFLKNIRTVNV